MADLPIPFSAPMVRALLDGRKTQTRRIIDWCRDDEPRATDVVCIGGREGEPLFPRFRPRYAVGDRLYVRERIVKWFSCGKPHVRFGADEKSTFHDWPSHWVRDFAPPMLMPKAFSRLTLKVTSVYVQRLQEISEEDAIAEGVAALGADNAPDEMEDHRSFRWGFETLWDSLNAERDKGAYSWANNPWVAAYSFEVVKGNIDKVET